MFVHLQNGEKINRTIYLLKFLEGLNEIIYAEWVINWLTNKCSRSAGGKLLFVLSIISFTKYLPPPSLMSSSGHRLYPQSISLSGLFLSLLLSLPLPINHPTLHSHTCICPWLSYYCHWLHYATLSITELQHHPDQHQTQQNHKVEVAALRGSMEVRIWGAEAESGGQLIPGKVAPVELEQHSVI